jgi:hypothetical protein
MAINFPASPSVNDTYSYGTRTWQWDGLAWKQISLQFGPQGPIGPTGPTGPSAQTLGITNFTGATYSITSSDVNKILYMSNTAPGLVTVTAGVMTVGQQAQVVRAGVGNLNIVGGAGVTIVSSGFTIAIPILRTTYSAASIICLSTNSYLVSGDIV